MIKYGSDPGICDVIQPGLGIDLYGRPVNKEKKFIILVNNSSLFEKNISCALKFQNSTQDNVIQSRLYFQPK